MILETTKVILTIQNHCKPIGFLSPNAQKLNANATWNVYARHEDLGWIMHVVGIDVFDLSGQSFFLKIMMIKVGFEAIGDCFSLISKFDSQIFIKLYGNSPLGFKCSSFSYLVFSDVLPAYSTYDNFEVDFLFPFDIYVRLLSLEQ